MAAYDNHVLPFLWLKGEARETITEYLEQIASADVREVCLESRTHPEFCRDGWWSDLRFIIGECKRLGMKIWLLDDAHFPTGYANGALAGEDADPRLKKTVLKHRVATVVGPQPSTSIKLGNLMDPTERFVGAAAFDAAGVPLDLELIVEQTEDGTPARLRFDAPAGVTALELYVTSRKTGFRDEYINMVDADSCRVLIDAVYEPTFEHLGDEFGHTILGFFTDEPGFMNEKGTTLDDASTSSFIGRSDLALSWSDELARRLHEALGANWLAELRGLWTREAGGAQVRHTYMDIATQLYRACFDEQIGDWCRERGVMHIGHVIEDKSCHARLGQGAGHYFRAVAGQDMAGIDVVINQLAPGIDHGPYSYFHGAWNMEFFTYALAKLGSSAARLDSKKQGRCMAEVFGAFGWHEGLREMKWIADHMLVRGINWFTPHAFSMVPFPDWDCPPHFYAHGNNPQWPHFGKLMSYMNRTATLLSGGSAARPVAILYHADAEWAGDAMPVERVAAELTRAQIDFDFVPAEAFEDEDRYEVSIADGMLAVNDCRYQAFVMPGASFIGAATAQAVRRIAAAGVMVLAVDKVPSALYDADGDADLDDLAVTPLNDVARTLACAGLQTVVADTPQPWLRALRYEHAGETYIMLVNEHPRERIDCTVTLARGERLCGTRLDLLNGTESVAFDGVLELAPFESCFVVLGADGELESRDDAGMVPSDAIVLDIDNPWTVALSPAGSNDAFGEPQKLEHLCDLTSELFANTCGTYRYRTSFELASDLADATIDLGDVYETAALTLDGQPLGTRICPPYRFATGSLTVGTHELTIDVINTLDHAVSDIFTLTEPVAPSGILGPVTLCGQNLPK